MIKAMVYLWNAFVGRFSDRAVISGGMLPSSMSPPTPAQNARQGSRHKGRDGDGEFFRSY